MAQLVLTYQYDGTPDCILDDFGRLRLSVETEKFSGRGGFWVQWQDIREFAEQLKTYPIPMGKPLVAQWGYKMLEEEHVILRVEVGPVKKTGGLRVGVEIADDDRDTRDRSPRERVRCSFATEYPQLEAFSRAIVEVMDGEAPSAVLAGR